MIRLGDNAVLFDSWQFAAIPYCDDLVMNFSLRGGQAETPRWR